MNPYLIILIISFGISLVGLIIRAVGHYKWAKAEMEMMGACIGFNLFVNLIIHVVIGLILFVIISGGYWIFHLIN